MSKTGLLRRNQAELFGSFGAFPEDREQAELFGVVASDWNEWDPNDVVDQFGFFKKLGRGLKKISRAVKKVAKNPLVKVAATGLAFVVPGAGAISMAGKIASQANKLYDATKSKNPKARKAARAVVKNTQRLAKDGDPSAKRAVKVLALSAKQRGRLRPKRAAAWTVYNDGKIAKGSAAA